MKTVLVKEVTESTAACLAMVLGLDSAKEAAALLERRYHPLLSLAEAVQERRRIKLYGLDLEEFGGSRMLAGKINRSTNGVWVVGFRINDTQSRLVVCYRGEILDPLGIIQGSAYSLAPDIALWIEEV